MQDSEKEKRPLHKMSNNGIGGVRDSLTRRLAEAERDRLHRRAAPIVDCIRKMRAEGFADNEIAGLFRHAADELDARRRTTKPSPPLKFELSNYCFAQQLRQPGDIGMV